MLERYFKRVGVNEEGLTVWELREEGLNSRAKTVQVVEDNGCLRVVSHLGINNIGHTFVKRKGKGILAHRYVWQLANGKEIPKGLVVRHKCNIPDCINPLHLEIGTQADNMRDRDERGRTANAISDLNAVLAFIADGTTRKTADIIGCSNVQVSVIRNGKQRPYIKAFVDSKLPNVKIPLEHAIKLKWLFDDITECKNDDSIVI